MVSDALQSDQESELKNELPELLNEVFNYDASHPPESKNISTLLTETDGSGNAAEGPKTEVQSANIQTECKFCPMVYMSRTGLEKHMKKVHWNKTAASRTMLEEFREPDTDESTYTCNVCSEQFQCAYFFKKHICQVHQMLTGFKFCDLCTKVYIGIGEFVLYKHQYEVHGISRPIAPADTFIEDWRDKYFMDRYECRFCPIYYKNDGNSLLKHMNSLHKNFADSTKTRLNIFEKYLEKVTRENESDALSVDIYRCKACADDFDDYHEFKKHVYSAHGPVNTYVTCDICQKWCTHLIALTSHKQKEHNVKICGRLPHVPKLKERKIKKLIKAKSQSSKQRKLAKSLVQKEKKLAKQRAKKIQTRDERAISLSAKRSKKPVNQENDSDENTPHKKGKSSDLDLSFARYRLRECRVILTREVSMANTADDSCQQPCENHIKRSEHELSHTELFKNCCTPCDETFYTLYQYEQHMAEMHSWD